MIENLYLLILFFNDWKFVAKGRYEPDLGYMSDYSHSLLSKLGVIFSNFKWSS